MNPSKTLITNPKVVKRAALVLPPSEDYETIEWCIISEFQSLYYVEDYNIEDVIAITKSQDIVTIELPEAAENFFGEIIKYFIY